MVRKTTGAYAGAFVALSIAFQAWADPPAESGIVSRILVEDEFVVAFYDPGDDLSHVVGIDIVGLCSGVPPDQAIGDYSVQQMLVDEQGSNLDRIVYRNTAEGYAGVWQGDVLSGDVCADVLGALPVAEGTVRWRYRDNDIGWFNDCDASGTPNRNANAWGFTWNGVLEDYFGQPTPYLGEFSAVWQECDPSTFRERAQVQLRGYTN